ncbi:MAG: 7-carboxy-7-deazaguanine synthase QueE [Alphaproteobacteria bacterium]|nr:7-carboxy-7-deazaguanine synthase QueE [Alphaproteobacteria bacterium]
MTETIRISEIFGPTIQGEGALIGQPTVFVRTGGCDYRCTWCDTMHAVDSKFRDTWKPMTAQEIIKKVEELSGGKPIMITLSGGNPAIQPLGSLIELGKRIGYRFTLETQGSVSADWFQQLDILTLSPKPPSSNMEINWPKFEECLLAAKNKPQIALKIPVLDDGDYNFARDVAVRYPDIPLYLQPVNEMPEKPDADHAKLLERMRWLTEKVTKDQWYEATILPQLHVLLWGHRKGV